ncbi:MAG: beta-N-acetylhexosaminidase [Tannerellaceae bacterium]|nr:beta-N-acetylhexosaminidase [Tannerellaceae bacterium]
MKRVMYMMAFAVGLIFFQSCVEAENVPLDNTSLIPAPYHLTGKSGSPFILDESTTITYSDASLQEVAHLLSGHLSKETGLPLKVENTPSAAKSKSIHLKVAPAINALEPLPQPIGISAKDGNPKDEFYTLSVSSNKIEIASTAIEGVYRGISSLRQIVNGSTKDANSFQIVSREMIDGPKFAWRGISFDVSRCFFDMHEVKQMIDMLALYKMNVLHWHLTDNQGWRVEIKKYPKLTEIGSQIPNGNRKGGYFTQEQYKEIIQYAADRFITVVPEIDMPGHTAAVFASYPELKNAVNLQNIKFNIPGQALGALDPDDENTMGFVEDVLTELAAMTPGSYLHIGGDETFGMPEDKFIMFIDKVRPMVHKLGKKMVGWQETSRASIGSGDLIQHWIYLNTEQAFEENDNLSSMLSPEFIEILKSTFAEAAHDVERALGKNAQIIMSPSGFVYLDHSYKETSTDPNQQAEADRLGMPAYPKQTVEEMFNWNPITFNPSIKPENIAGVECAIWCETIESFSDLQFLVLPRLSGVAEKAWSDNGTGDWNEYRVRLGSQAPLWQRFGWNYFKSSLVDWK